MKTSFCLFLSISFLIILLTVCGCGDKGGPTSPSEQIGGSWRTTSTTNAPSAREGHTMIWTGIEVIVWGGTAEDNITLLNTGGKYNPSTDSWSTISTTNAPSPRIYHTAIWTGTEMIIWGGSQPTGGFFGPVNTGGRYNPSTDKWTLISGGPKVALHAAVWTGSEMIIWGSSSSNAAFRYNPSTDTWTESSTTNAPDYPREYPLAVWTGSEMLVWGGEDNYFHPVYNGGRYNPYTDIWHPIPTTTLDVLAKGISAVWTGTEMIIWGGYLIQIVNTGGRYNPSTNSWIAISTTNAPSARANHTAVWTGTEMIIWGGGITANSGGKYNPSTDTWSATSTTNAPSARFYHKAVWTGSEMIIWGGVVSGELRKINTGARYRP